MRFGLVSALVSCCMLFVVPSSIAEVIEPQVPVPMADVAKGKAPAISNSGGKLYVAFQNDAAIFFAESSDSGKSWSSSRKVSGANITAAHPSIAAGADGSVNIVWQAKAPDQKEPGVFFVRSSDGGKVFSEPIDISTTKTASSEAQVTVAPDNSVHVAWIDTLPAPAGPDVFYTASSDGGKTWSKREDVSNTPGGVSSHPSIAVGADSRVHIVWVDTTSGDDHPDIFYSFKSGKSWSEPQDLSKDSGYSEHPGIACGPKGKVHIVWSDNTRKNAGDILCLIEHHAGHFGKPINISNSRGVSGQPMLSVNNEDRSAVVWIDTSSTLKVPDIWARTSYDDAFSKEVELCHTDGESIHPNVTLADDKAFTVWEEVEGGVSTVKGCLLKLK